MHTEGPKAEARKTREVSPATPRRTWLTKRTGEREASGRELHREGRKLRLRTSVRSASELSLQHRTREELAGWLAGWLAAPSQAKEKRHGKAERKRQHWRKRIGYETERERLISSLTGNKKEEENWERRRVRHEVVENPDLALQPRISSKFTFI